MPPESTIPRISILMPLLNADRFLADTVLTVQAQACGSWEIVMVDGGSSDGTAGIAARLATLDPRIRFFTAKGTGFWEALYRAHQESRGEFVTILCASDGYVNSEWLQEIVFGADAHPDVSLFWGIPFIMGEDGVLAGPHPNYVMFLERKPALWHILSVWHYISVRLRYLNPFRLAELARKISLRKVAHAVSQVVAVPPPQKGDWFAHWLKTGMIFPDGNMCIKKGVFYECAFKDNGDNALRGALQVKAHFDFYFNFNSHGYLSWCLPVPANFGRTHEGQSTQVMREREGDRNAFFYDEYNARIARLAEERQALKLS